MVKKVYKRSGRKVKYDRDKIIMAVFNALEETLGKDEEKLYKIAENITRQTEEKIEEEFKQEYPTVEKIQDIVEEILMDNGYHKTAKAYILYRDKQDKKRKKWLSNGRPMDIWTNKYQFKGESFVEFFDRIAKDNDTVKKYLKEKVFSPAGRILANRGLQEHGIKVSFSNCYTSVPPEDDLESIFDTAKRLARTFSFGGGSGITLSNLRPNGARVNNAAKTTTGSVSFSELYGMVSGLIGQKNRRSINSAS